MRHADAELQLWLANDRIDRDRREVDLANLAREASATPSLRRRAGLAVIAAGERLAGDRSAGGSRSMAGRRLAQRTF